MLFIRDKNLRVLVKKGDKKHKSAHINQKITDAVILI